MRGKVWVSPLNDANGEEEEGGGGQEGDWGKGYSVKRRERERLSGGGVGVLD